MNETKRSSSDSSGSRATTATTKAIITHHRFLYIFDNVWGENHHIGLFQWPCNANLLYTHIHSTHHRWLYTHYRSAMLYKVSNVDILYIYKYIQSTECESHISSGFAMTSARIVVVVVVPFVSIPRRARLFSVQNEEEVFFFVCADCRLPNERFHPFFIAPFVRV